MMIVWPTKGPTEAYDFAFDFSAALVAGESIVSKIVAGDGVTVDAADIVAAEVVVSLSGGTKGTVAKVTCAATTNASPPRVFSEVAVLIIGGDAVSLADAKAAQKIETSDEDVILGAFLRSAVRHIETRIGKNLTQQIESQKADGFPCGPSSWNDQSRQDGTTGSWTDCRRVGAIRLWKGPVSEIVSVKYDDENGVEQTLSSFRLVEGKDAKLLPAFGETWPLTACGPGTVRIQYVAGYDPADRDLAELSQAAIMLFGHFNAHREAVIASDRAAAVELPLGVEALIASYLSGGIA